MTRELSIFDETLEMRYDRSTAPSTRRFLTALRDDATFVGGHCDCGHTHVPPRDVCPECGAAVEAFEPVEPVGHLLSWTTDEDPPDRVPFEGPVTFGIVRLEGADGALVHVVGDGLDPDLQPGARVEARFLPEEERQGSILDVERFEVVG